MTGPAGFGGHSMGATLRRVLICAPDAAGWADEAKSSRWKELGYHGPVNAVAAISEHAALEQALADAGAEVLRLPADGGLSIDAIYAHDASLVTDHGALLMRMGKAARAAEPERHAAFFKSHGIPVFGAVEAPGTLEAGDVVWLDRQTLLIGRGYRSNEAGIAQVRALLRPHGIDVVEAPLPHGAGPEECLHLMSLMSVLDDRVAVVDSCWLAVSVMELLSRLEFRLIPIDPAERRTMAPNVLSLGQRRLVALEENTRTNQRLEESGFKVTRIAGRAMAHNGSGGPTCLTRPLLRD